MDPVSQQSHNKKCTIHSENNIEFAKISDLSNSVNCSLFCCSVCINKEEESKENNYMNLSLLEKSKTKIIQRWPPVDDYSIINQLVQLTDEENKYSSIINSIKSYFAQIKKEILSNFERCQQKMINYALELPIKNQWILKQYQQISQISQLKALIIGNLTNENEIYQQRYRQFIAKMQSQKSKSNQMLQNLLEDCNEENQQYLNFEYPDLIKNSILSLIDQIDLFTPADLQNNPKNVCFESNPNQCSSKVMKLISNKSNFCSESFLSQLSGLLQKVNPLLESITFDNMHEVNKHPINFSGLNQKSFELIIDQINHSIQLEKSHEYRLKIERSGQYQQLEQIINSSVNFISDDSQQQLKEYIIQTYPFFKQIELSKQIREQEKFDCFRSLSYVEIEDLYTLINKRKEFNDDNKYHLSETVLFLKSPENVLKQYDFADIILKKYPVFDLMRNLKDISIDVKLIKTAMNDGHNRIDIHDGLSVSINPNYDGIYKRDCYVNCISDIVLEQEKKYVFRFQVQKFRDDSFNFSIGLMQNCLSDGIAGFYNNLSCCLSNVNSQIQQNGGFGIEKMLKGDKLRLSKENQIEMRISLTGQQLEILDYPNYEYKVAIQDQYKTKLIEDNDLKLYIGMYSEEIKITLIHSSIVSEFLQ